MTDSDSSSESFDPMQARINEMKFNQLQRELRQKEELKKQQLQAEILPPHVDKDVGSNKVATNFFRNQNQNMNKESNSK